MLVIDLQRCVPPGLVARLVLRGGGLLRRFGRVLAWVELQYVHLAVESVRWLILSLLEALTLVLDGLRAVVA